MNRLEVKPLQIKVFKEKRQGRRRRFLGENEAPPRRRAHSQAFVTVNLQVFDAHHERACLEPGHQSPVIEAQARALLRASSADPVSGSHDGLVGDDPSSKSRRNANADPSSESRGNIGTDPDSDSCARALLRAASVDPVSGSHDRLMGDDPSLESRRNVGADPNTGSCVRALLRAASADPVSSSHDELMSVDPFSAPTPTHTR
ncbi:hypothetical protein FH972_020615 [Carpinus fangiana]|uniref:Uncharacterized protein n=1 Tax=Carpinus fangiana TaxID=176857 RepID=A0A5N6RTS0_9ROSI|nr:hypothetical protein FH972_020615 [Carpinus fangiana]